MKISEIPFNMKSSFDEGFIERPDNLDEMVKGIEFLKEKLNEDLSSLQRASILSTLGNFCRVINSLEQAQEYLIDSYEQFSAKDAQAAATVAKFRLGLVFLYQKKFIKADSMISSSLSFSANSNEPHLSKLIPSMSFSFGLSKLWQQEITSASSHFTKCVEFSATYGSMKYMELGQKALGHCQNL